MTVLSPAAPQTVSETPTIDAKIRAYIRESFLFGSDLRLRDEDSLIDAGIIDSTGAMELVSFIDRCWKRSEAPGAPPVAAI